MEFTAIVERLKAACPEVTAPAVAAGDTFVVLPVARNLELLKLLRDDPDLAFDNLMDLSGVDTGKELWVVYQVHSFKHKHRLAAKVILPRENPALESVRPVWIAADFFEREVYDLFGVTFLNHPDLRRLLLPFDWTGWPGRKDYVFPKEYDGIPLARQDQFFGEDVAKTAAAHEAEWKKLLEKERHA